jgi:putative membrane protein
MLADLHTANQSEVDLGKVAEQQAQSKDVKAFGKRMVKDHTALDKDVQSWAKKNNVSVGAPPQDDAHQAEMKKMQELKDRLQSLSGTEFDKTYMQAMAEDHANDLSKVQTFEQQTTNKSLKKLLEKSRKVIASHKKDADKLVQKLGATAAR